MKTLYAIMVEPEAYEAELFSFAYETLADAQEEIRASYGDVEAKSDYVFKDKDYTYYKIIPIEFYGGTK